MKQIMILARALRLPPKEATEALKAIVLLGYISIALKILPFSRVIRLGSVDLNSTTTNPEALVDAGVRAIKRASLVTPWRTVCIHEGLALQRLLRRQGLPAVLYYGANSKDEKLEGHVWVNVLGRSVIGGDVAGDYHVLATYPHQETAEKMAGQDP